MLIHCGFIFKQQVFTKCQLWNFGYVALGIRVTVEKGYNSCLN